MRKSSLQAKTKAASGCDLRVVAFGLQGFGLWPSSLGASCRGAVVQNPLFSSDAKQVLKSPEKNFPVADGRRGKHLLANPVFSYSLKGWTRLEYCN